jgi:hypothetical protein
MAIVVLTFRSAFYDLEDNREGNTTGNNKDDDNNNDDIDLAQEEISRDSPSEIHQLLERETFPRVFLEVRTIVVTNKFK